MINPSPADNIIRAILDSPNETKSIEFKPSFPWPIKSDDLPNSPKALEVVKAILAMSNIRDGGKIILGVDEDTNQKIFNPKGMQSTDLATFDQDDIFQQVRNYGSPEPRFQVLNLVYNKMNFIIFAVQEFLFVPVLCNNASKKVLPGFDHTAFYIRTDKPETKKVTKTDEMHEIIQLAVDKQLSEFWRRKQSFDHIGKSIDEFDEELKDIK